MAEPRPFTPEQDAYLVANYATMKNANLEAYLGRHRRRIRERAKQLGLVKQKISPTRTPRGPSRVAWTEAEIATLRAEWLSNTLKQLATKLGRPENGVQNKARRLGLPRKEGFRGYVEPAPSRMHPQPRPKAPPNVETIINARADMKKRPGALFFRSMGTW